MFNLENLIGIVIDWDDISVIHVYNGIGSQYRTDWKKM